MVALQLDQSTAIAQEVDIELVLAVDGSGSVDEEEMKLQLEGYSAAFLDPEIQRAMLSGPVGKVAVAMMVWSDAAFPKFTTNWHVLDSRQSIEKFASRVQGFHQHIGRYFGVGGGGTGIGDGVAYSIKMIEQNGISGLRKVVDVSGDGIETEPWFKGAVMMPYARELASLNQVTINGLAILSDFTSLDQWYREFVITGPGSFVVKAEDFHDFKRAVREKLWREFSQHITWWYRKNRPVKTVQMTEAYFEKFWR